MPGNIKDISDGQISGTGTISLDGKLFGGIDLSCDGTNLGTAIIRDNDGNGKKLVHTSAIGGKTVIAPFQAPSGQIYYSISGTGATGTLYEWIE